MPSTQKPELTFFELIDEIGEAVGVLHWPRLRNENLRRRLLQGWKTCDLVMSKAESAGIKKADEVMEEMLEAGKEEQAKKPRLSWERAAENADGLSLELVQELISHAPCPFDETPGKYNQWVPEELKAAGCAAKMTARAVMPKLLLKRCLLFLEGGMAEEEAAQADLIARDLALVAARTHLLDKPYLFDLARCRALASIKSDDLEGFEAAVGQMTAILEKAEEEVKKKCGNVTAAELAIMRQKFKTFKVKHGTPTTMGEKEKQSKANEEKAKQPQIDDEIETRNDLYPALSAAAKVNILANGATEVIATRKIMPGEILMLEEPAMKLANSHFKDAIYKVCSHCFKSTRYLLPCPNCSQFLVCSVACRDEALGSYHKFECKAGVLGAYKSRGKSNGDLLSIALRYVFSCEYGYLKSKLNSDKEFKETKRSEEVKAPSDPDFMWSLPFFRDSTKLDELAHGCSIMCAAVASCAMHFVRASDYLHGCGDDEEEAEKVMKEVLYRVVRAVGQNLMPTYVSRKKDGIMSMSQSGSAIA